MKLIVLIVLFVLTLLAQLFFLQSWQIAGVTANIMIAFLVVACLFIDAERMLWLGLVAGLMFDFYSSADFGLNLGFYILLVVVCKYLLKFGESEHSWWRPALVAGIATSLYALMLALNAIFSSFSWSILAQVVLSGVLSAAAAGLWWLLLSNIFEASNRVNLERLLRR